MFLLDRAQGSPHSTSEPEGAESAVAANARDRSPDFSPRLVWIAGPALVVTGLSAFLLAVLLTHVVVEGVDQFDRAGYCSVAGNTASDGSAFPPGTFLDLIVGAPTRDGRLTGAVPANYVEGVGITCAAPPPGFVRRGFASSDKNVPGGIHPYYVPGGS